MLSHGCMALPCNWMQRSLILSQKLRLIETGWFMWVTCTAVSDVMEPHHRPKYFLKKQWLKEEKSTVKLSSAVSHIRTEWKSILLWDVADCSGRLNCIYLSWKLQILDKRTVTFVCWQYTDQSLGGGQALKNILSHVPFYFSAGLLTPSSFLYF